MELQSFDESYIARLRSGDVNTEGHFFQYFSKLIFIKLRSRLRSRNEIEDIQQETFMRVLTTLRSEHGLRHAERLGSFVNSVCNNVLLEHYRGAQRQGVSSEDVAEPIDYRVDPEKSLLTEQNQRKVREVLDKMPDRDRQILRAIFLEEKDKDDVCQTFGVGRDYLRVMLHRAKLQFKEKYSRAEAAGR